MVAVKLPANTTWESARRATIIIVGLARISGNRGAGGEDMMRELEYRIYWFYPH
jgi:hypothetical protein